jgi:hypothetical protein
MLAKPIMTASKRRQLNVNSTEAYELAHALAEKNGTTTVNVVLAALRQMAGKRTIPSTKVTPEEADENFRRIMEGVREANRLHPVKLDYKEIDEWMYDEHGLPK